MSPIALGVGSILRPFISLCHCCVESKTGSIGSHVTHWQISLAIIAALYASLALSEDFNTIEGKKYKNATVRHADADGIVVKTKSAITMINITEHPKDVHEQ